MTNVVQAIQTTLTYSNLAFQLITGEVNDIAHKLNLPESLPVQGASNFNFTIEGKTVGVAGHIYTDKFEYEFRDGVIQKILRSDFDRDVEVQDPLLSHLTNEVLVLTKERAKTKAFEMLSQVSFDIEKLKEFFDVKVKDEFLTLRTFDLERKRLGLPWKSHRNSPTKIQIAVSFTLKGTDERSGPELKFIATTGDLLSFYVWDFRELKRLGIFQKQLMATNAVDLSLPTFFTGTAFDSTSASLKESKILSLVRDAVDQVQQNLGTNKPSGFLVCDNLNAPELVSRELASSLTNAFFAGTSIHWSTNLPFSREQQDAVSKDKRGIYIVGFDGNFKTELREIEKPILINSENKSKEEKEKTTRENSQIADKVMSEIFQKMKLSDREETLLLPLGQLNDDDSGIWADAFYEIAKKSSPPVFRAYSSFSGQGSFYWNGKMLTNNLGFLRISGALPYHEWLSGDKTLDGQPFEPFFRDSFGPHPFEGITRKLGLATIDVMRRAERVETVRIELDFSDKPPAKVYEGYSLIGKGKTQGNAFARSLSEAIINEKNRLDIMKNCIFSPGVIFKLWHGKEMVKLTICFTCDDILIERYDAEGKKAHSAFFDFSANRAALLRLCKTAFPEDRGIQVLKED